MGIESSLGPVSDEEAVGRRNVVAMGVTSLLTDVSTEMVLASLPFFITEELGGGMAALGAIEGAAELTASALKAVSGRVSDIMGRRKPLALLGYSLSAVLKPLMALATSWLHVLAVRVGDRVGKGIRTSPRDALIADSVGEEFRGRAFGVHRAMDTAGAVIGPLLALALIPRVGFRATFAASAVPGLAGVLVLAGLVKEIRRAGRGPVPPAKGTLTPEFKLYLTSISLFSLGQFSYAFILSRLVELGWSRETAIALYTASNVIYSAMAIPAGGLGDRLGKLNALTLGYLSLTATSIIAATGSRWTGPAAIAAFGVYMALVDTLERAALPALVPDELRGTAYGAFHAAKGVSTLPGNLAFGLLYDRYGAQVAFGFSACLSLVSLAPLLLLISKRRSS